MPVRYTDSTAATDTALNSWESNWIPLDIYTSPFNVSFAITRTSAAAAHTVAISANVINVEHTLVNVLAGEVPASAQIYRHSEIQSAAVASSQTGNYQFPISAIRFSVSAYSTGDTLTFQVIQAG